MRALRARGFSLVEVAISTTVMASAALLLGAALGTSNGQKSTARRIGLAKSLAVRQLELIQQRLNESIDGTQIVNMAANPTLRLAALRGAGTYNINHEPNTPHYYCYRNDPTLPLTPSAGRSVEVLPTSVFHVMCPSTVATVPTPAGTMLPDEALRIGQFGEQLGVNLYLSAVQTDGHVDNPPVGSATPAGQAQLPVQMRQPELIIAQVVVNDLSNNTPMFTLSRMYRVQSAAAFALDGQF